MASLRGTKRFCSAKCRLLAFRKRDVSVSEKSLSVTDSVSPKDLRVADETVVSLRNELQFVDEEYVIGPNGQKILKEDINYDD